jgi:urease accessory protein
VLLGTLHLLRHLTAVRAARQIPRVTKNFPNPTHGLVPWLTGAVILTPCTARAHTAVAGAGEIANGALHPLMTPAHLLILLALGLMLGQQKPLNLRWRVGTLAGASALALLLNLTGVFQQGGNQAALVGIALVLAILVALDRKLPPVLPEVLCLVAAGGIGIDSGVETGTSGSLLKNLLGTWLVVNSAVFYIAVCASNGAERKWARAGIRVLGSWIIAISFMVLAFALRR